MGDRGWNEESHQAHRLVRIVPDSFVLTDNWNHGDSRPRSDPDTIRYRQYQLRSWYGPALTACEQDRQENFGIWVQLYSFLQ